MERLVKKKIVVPLESISDEELREEEESDGQIHSSGRAQRDPQQLHASLARDPFVIGGHQQHITYRRKQVIEDKSGESQANEGEREHLITPKGSSLIGDGPFGGSMLRSKDQRKKGAMLSKKRSLEQFYSG